MRNFTCGECKETFPARQLSRQSRIDAGTSIPEAALNVLSPHLILCKNCGDGVEEDSASWRVAPGRTDRERFELCGLHIDPARWQAYCLSN